MSASLLRYQRLTRDRFTAHRARMDALSGRCDDQDAALRQLADKLRWAEAAIRVLSDRQADADARDADARRRLQIQETLIWRLSAAVANLECPPDA